MFVDEHSARVTGEMQDKIVAIYLCGRLVGLFCAIAMCRAGVVSRDWADGKLTLKLDDGTAEMEWLSATSFRFARSWTGPVASLPKITHDTISPEFDEAGSTITMRTRLPGGGARSRRFEFAGSIEAECGGRDHDDGPWGQRRCNAGCAAAGRENFRAAGRNHGPIESARGEADSGSRLFLFERGLRGVHAMAVALHFRSE